MSLQLPWPYVPGAPGSGIGAPEEFADKIQQNFDALAITVGPLAQYTPTRVTTLPSSPFDGQEIYYVADATNGITWHFKYRSASASAYKWEFVGGGYLTNQVFAEETPGSSGAWINLTTDGPKVTVPFAGDYEWMGGAHIRLTAASRDLTWGVAIGNGSPVGVAPWFEVGSAPAITGNLGVDVPSSDVFAAVAAANVLKMRYLANNTANISVRQRWLRVRPVRVG